MEYIQLAVQVVTLVIVSVAALAVRGSVSSYFSEKARNLATKQDVAEITTEVERVRTAFLEHQAEFTLFHTQKFETIGGVYERLNDAAECVSHMVHPVQFGGEEEETERRTKASEAYNDFAGFYWRRKIYLPEEICDRTEVVLRTMKTAIHDYVVARRPGSHNIDRWNAAHKSMENDVPPLKNDLERLMRDTITVTPSR